MMTLEMLKEHCEKTINPNGKLIFDTNSNVYKEHKLILDLIKEHEERTWVQCSERLPEVEDYVIVTWHNELYSADKKYIGMFEYTKEDGFIPDNLLSWKNHIIVDAWMTLPEPYKESD